MIHKSCVFFIRPFKWQLSLYIRPEIILLLWQWSVIFCESCNGQVFTLCWLLESIWTKLYLSQIDIQIFMKCIFCISLISFGILFYVFIDMVFLMLYFFFNISYIIIISYFTSFLEQTQAYIHKENNNIGYCIH